MSKPASLTDRIAKARVASAPGVADRAKRGLLAYVQAMAGKDETAQRIVADLTDGTAAQNIGRIGLSDLTPQGLDCAKGCAFCCILSGADGGTISEAEAVQFYHALAPVAGQPDGRDWHPKACAALDPNTRMCRAYDARPMICRSYVSTDVTACEAVAEGQAMPGPGTLAPYHTYLAALGLGRAAFKGLRRVSTHSLSRLAAATVAGDTLEDALSLSRHKPAELDAELRRSKRDLSRAAPSEAR